MSANLFRIDVSAPASVANLGSGYDCVAMAVSLVNSFTLYTDLRKLLPGEAEFTIDLEGDRDYTACDPSLNAAQTNSFVRAFKRARRYLWQRTEPPLPQCPFFLSEVVRIPPTRGLGSSSSASVAGVLAAFRFVERLDPSCPGLRTPDGGEPVELYATLAFREDHCQDNICGCLSGGLAYSFVVGEEGDRLRQVHFFSEPVDDPDLRIVVVIPRTLLKTDVARERTTVAKYSNSDAVFNLSRSTCLPAVFRTRRYELLRDVTRDKMHQVLRMSLYKTPLNNTIPIHEIFDAAMRAGAYAACISGAGSSIVAFAHKDHAEAVKRAFYAACEDVAGDDWPVKTVMILQPSNQGCVVDSGDLTEPIPPNVRTWLDASVVASQPHQRVPLLAAEEVEGNARTDAIECAPGQTVLRAFDRMLRQLDELEDDLRQERRRLTPEITERSQQARAEYSGVEELLTEADVLRQRFVKCRDAIASDHTWPSARPLQESRSALDAFGARVRPGRWPAQHPPGG